MSVLGTGAAGCVYFIPCIPDLDQALHFPSGDEEGLRGVVICSVIFSAVNSSYFHDSVHISLREPPAPLGLLHND